MLDSLFSAFFMHAVMRIPHELFSAPCCTPLSSCRYGGYVPHPTLNSRESYLAWLDFVVPACPEDPSKEKLYVSTLCDLMSF